MLVYQALAGLHLVEPDHLEHTHQVINVPKHIINPTTIVEVQDHHILLHPDHPVQVALPVEVRVVQLQATKAEAVQAHKVIALQITHQDLGV